MAESLTYADAGVDIDKANALVKSIKKIAKSTRQSGVMGDIGGFGGLFLFRHLDLWLSLFRGGDLDGVCVICV